MAHDFSLEATLAELAPTPQKWRRAVRVASITAIGAGVTAAMQIANPLGLTMLVNLSLPEAAFPLTRGIVFLFCAAMFQTLAIAGAAALANSPALELAAFILLSLATSYLIYAVPILGRLWVWIQVPVITSFYMILFVPGALGEDHVQMFAGMAIAVGVLSLFNNLVWPEPAQIVLRDSLDDAIARARARFARLIAILVGDTAASEDRSVASQLGRHIALLGQVYRMSNQRELGLILATVMRIERIHNQLDHLSAIAGTRPGAVGELPAAGIELRSVALAIDQMFIGLAAKVRRETAQTDKHTDGQAQLDTSFDPRPRLLQIVQINPELADMVEAIAAVSDLLDEDNFALVDEELANLDDSPLLAHGATPFLVRFAARHTLALAIAFLLGLWDNNPALHAAIWLLMLGGPPSHGATVRKFTMRAVGASGALALAALGTIVVAPNYTSLVSYMAVIFVGVLLMAYIGEGGGILSYLAIGGTAFIIGYSGPGPRTDVLDSIWSIWGISLGMIIRAALSLVWREHSYQTLAEEFPPLFKAILDLVRPATSNVAEGIAARTEVIRSTLVMLGVANDALLEGRSAGIDANRLIEVLDILLRLSFDLGPANRVNTGPESMISQPVAAAMELRFKTWLGMLNAETEGGAVKPAPLRRMVIEAESQLNPTGPSNGAGAPQLAIRNGADRRIISLMLVLEQKLTQIWLER